MNASTPFAKNTMPRILIIDDEPLMVRMLEMLLGTYGDCDCAHDGDQALPLISDALNRSAPYALICLDIMMPGRDGLSVLEEIRNLEKTDGSTTPAYVVMVSARGDEQSKRLASEKGANAYVEKDAALEQLPAIAQSVCKN